MGTEFVEDWTIVNTLGEGAFGEVKLLVNKTSGDEVAVKIIDLEKHPDAADNVNKEICIHRMLSNDNIIRFFGQRKESTREYIFLEYAAGGELFDRIEPDIGMPDNQAQRYMRQLVAGVGYLHDRGVAHRDLKPENLLLDANDNLKISDFGMATVFRIRGKERILDTRCGTLPYVAPEVLKKRYRAQPADIWSCGIILTAMLSGELPWDKPNLECPEYKRFRQEKFPTITPWTKLSNLALSLIYSMLKASLESRATLEQISKHRWMQSDLGKIGKNENKSITSVKRKCSDLSENLDEIDGITRICQSQPEARPVVEDVTLLADKSDKKEGGCDMFCFSQPTHLDDLLLNTQLHFTQSHAYQSDFQKLVKRMTRFFVRIDRENAIKTLCAELEKHGCKWNINSVGMMTVTTMDLRNMQLVFKAHVLDMDGKILIDFRLSNGCGLEFKRYFVKLKQGLSEIIDKNTPAWTPISVQSKNI